MRGLVAALLALSIGTLGFDVSLLWDVPDDATDITQASAQVQLNATSAPIGTEWIGVGWDTGAISIQKMADSQLTVLMQVRAPTSNTTVRAGRVTDYASAHYIDKKEQTGMYLQSKIDKDDAESSEFSLKVIAHYNMVANNTIYQGLWSDGQVWTYMGSLVLQHPKAVSIKEEVSRALENAAKADNSETPKSPHTTAMGSDDRPAIRTPNEPVIKDPLGGTKPPETLATCNINRNAGGKIRPVCKFIKQLPMVPSFSNPFSGLRRTINGNQKFERTGAFKNLSLKSRLANVFDIAAARCISHNRQSTDIASCQRDPNNPEFYIAIDGLTPH